MSYKISKELFEAVYNDVKVEEYYGVFQDEIQVQLKYCDHTCAITINDFFFKCKKWAVWQKYNIWLDYHEKKYFCFPTIKRAFISDSEQQSVFDACQWILDNKNKHRW